MQKTILFNLILSLFVSTSIAKDYKGAEVQSTESFHYGKFETRFYASDVSGILSTMFLFENDGWKDTDIWQEIDVEVFGKNDADEWQTNAIYEKKEAGPQLHAEEHHTIEGGSVADWHVYTVEWTPDYIRWFLDGEKVRTLDDTSIVNVLGAKPMLVMFNCWSHESVGWVGTLDTESLPTYQFVDYIKVYDWVSDSTFETEVSFEDDFSGSLTNWNKSTHTFDGNVADFASANVGSKDGYLILGFSKSGTTGVVYNAVIPEDPINSVSTKTETSFTITPNPVSDLITINADSWEIYSSQGVLMMIGQEKSIDLTPLPNGLYTISSSLNGVYQKASFIKK